MQVPLHLSFHNLDHSDAIEARVREKAAHLDRLYRERLTSCRVVVEARHKRQKQGRQYHVCVFLGVPGGEIAVNRDPEVSHGHEDMNAAIRDAFNAAERQLEDYIRKHRGDVKKHVLPARETQGKVARLLADGSGGFVETAEGEIYFHRNSVAGAAFDDLVPGQSVELAIDAEESAKGAQASTLRPIGAMRRDPAA